MSSKGKCRKIILLWVGLTSPLVFGAGQSVNNKLNTNWKGFYAGINAGGTWSGNSKTSILSSFVAGSQTSTYPNGAAYTGGQSALGASGSIPSSIKGFIGGGQVGYSWRLRDRLVEGIEVDFQGVSSGSNNGYDSNVVPLSGSFDGGNFDYFPGEQFSTSLTVSKRMSYFGTARGRFGWLATPKWLLSGTGGFAYGRVSSSASINQTNNDDLIFGAPGDTPLNSQTFSSGNYSSTRLGWTIGANAEWMFMPNWSAKLEYLYYDLGSISYDLSSTVLTLSGTPGPFAVVDSRVSARFNGNIVRVGVNYHFG